MNFELSAGLDQPSIFEVAAHERVVPSLFGAFEHAITVRVALPPNAGATSCSMCHSVLCCAGCVRHLGCDITDVNSLGMAQVMASRHPRVLLRVHKYRDEAFYLLMLLVERQCLHTGEASMAENLFSLIRAGAGSGDKKITPRHRRLSLVLLALLPYLQRKMERLCTPQLSIDDDEQPRQDAATAGGGGFQFPVEARQWARMAGGPTPPSAPLPSLHSKVVLFPLATTTSRVPQSIHTPD